MQKPFPELTYLKLQFMGNEVPILPDTFLGGSAPRLRSCHLTFILYPGLQKLLSSASHLVDLYLEGIPYSGYISPEAMVTCLSTVPSLKHFRVHFQSPRSRPDPRASQCPPLLTHTILPALTNLEFFGVSEYLEDFVSRIDAPLLASVDITFVHQYFFETPQLHQFFSRTGKLRTLNQPSLGYEEEYAFIKVSTESDSVSFPLYLSILCVKSDLLPSSMAQVCSSSLPPFSTLDVLRVERYWGSHMHDNIDNTRLLELLRRFTTVKSLYLNGDTELRVLSALQDLPKGRVTDVLPALKNLFLEGHTLSEPLWAAIAQFVGARQLSGHPIIVHGWDR